MNNLNKKIKSKIEKYIKLNNSSYLVLKTTNKFNVHNAVSKFNILINLELVNNIRRINKFHNTVNEVLNVDNYYIICSETLEERRMRVRHKTPFGFKNLIRIIDFTYKRVLPKIPLIKKIYFILTKGHNRVLSKAEILGRLISCGFSISGHFEDNNLFYVISRKKKNPDFNFSPSYSPIFKMNRIGYNGKVIGVYKLRTMYPYSEYLQELIIKENKLENSGKIANDYRITTWGKFCRKYWIDEFPMFINFFKGELSLIGVRPLSIGYFSKYPKEIQDLRIQIKPGLLPPYYADLPINFDEILLSEKKYINKKIKNPIRTDFEYFFKILINIFKGSRSQ